MRRFLVLQHVDREGPGLIIPIAENKGFRVIIFRLYLGDSLPKLIDGDLLLVLGGPMGINDIGNQTYPWLAEEVDLIKEALDKNIGIIGICLGAQLLSYVAGGDVEVLLEETINQPLAEIGWNPIFSNCIDNDNKFAKLLCNPIPVLHWHVDRILLPPNAELIASSCRCEEQLFKIGAFAYGLQFHIEISNEMVYRWIDEDKEFIYSSLGKKGQSILHKQQKQYGNKTLKARLEFLNTLVDLVG